MGTIISTLIGCILGWVTAVVWETLEDTLNKSKKSVGDIFIILGCSFHIYLIMMAILAVMVIQTIVLLD